MGSILRELRRRNVVRVAAAYLVTTPEAGPSAPRAEFAVAAEENSSDE